MVVAQEPQVHNHQFFEFFPSFARHDVAASLLPHPCNIISSTSACSSEILGFGCHYLPPLEIGPWEAPSIPFHTTAHRCLERKLLRSLRICACGRAPGTGGKSRSPMRFARLGSAGTPLPHLRKRTRAGYHHTSQRNPASDASNRRDDFYCRINLESEAD